MGWVYVFGGQTHLVHDTKWVGVGPPKFSKIPFNDHGVHLKGLQPPTYTHNTKRFLLAEDTDDTGVT